MSAKNGVECEYLTDKFCKTVSTGEGKRVRQKSCSNEQKDFCCYLCDHRKACKISCTYLDKARSNMRSTRMERAEENILEYYGKYLGGHGMYPREQSVVLSLYPEELVIEKLDLQIPYSVIKQVKNVKKEHMDALRVIAFGTIGALWKKEETYLCIVYNDGVQDQTPVFKLDHLDEAQREIYERVLEAERKTEVERETHYIICEYCHARYDANKNLKCPNCGAINH